MHMEIQLDQRNHQLPFHTELDRRPVYEWCTGDQLESTEKRTLPAPYENVPNIPLTHPRRLPPLQPHQSAARQDATQRAPFSHTQPPPLSTLPEQHLSKPIELQLLLNPISKDKTSASNRQHDGKGTGSSQITPLTETSSQPPVSVRENPLGDSLPSISHIYPLSQSPTTASLPPTSTRKKSLTAHTSLPPPHHTSPPSALQVTSTGEPQSFFSTSFTSGEKGFNAPTSVASGQGRYRTMTLETEQGTIQVPVDIQAASKESDAKRKRNATASIRFRQRRKEKEHETSTKISVLEAHVWELTEEKDFYQHWCEMLRGVILENNIFMPPPPTLSRHSRQASLGARLCQDNEASAPKQGKKRRTNAYAPTQAMPPMLSYIHTTAMPSKHTSTTTDASVSAMPS